MFAMHISAQLRRQGKGTEWRIAATGLPASPSMPVNDPVAVLNFQPLGSTICEVNA
jgi:hypothetical protein